MEQELDIPKKPKFRERVSAVVRERAAEISLGASRCSFEFHEDQRQCFVLLVVVPQAALDEDQVLPVAARRIRRVGP